MSAQPTRRSPSANSMTLNSAIKKGHFHLIRDLVDRGCNVNERDQENRTPLMLCAVVEDEKWSLSVARLLIENGAKIWLCDKTGKNALMAACLNERLSLIEVLLQSLDFNLNAQDKFGCTALHHCAMCGNTKISKLIVNRLLRYDLPILLTNKINKTPVDCALELGYFECAEAISADAKIQKQNWDLKKQEMERKRSEEKEKVMKRFQKVSTVSLQGSYDQNETGVNNNKQIAGLATVTEGGSTHAAASYIDAVEIPVTGYSAPAALNDANFKPMLKEALDQLAEEKENPSKTGIIIDDVEIIDTPKIPQSLSRPKTANSRKISPGRIEGKPKLSSTPRIRSATAKPSINNTNINNYNASLTNQTNTSVTSVLKQAKDREMTAKRQDFRRALSALPNRKRVRESKISFQSRKSGEIILSRPRTAISTSIVFNRDDFVYTSFVRPLFEVYREHLTDAFRPSVAAIQAAYEEKERLRAKEDIDGDKKPTELGGRESVDSNKKLKSKKKPSASGVGKKK
ncbi:uncharacterized protein LOC142354670 [Convolutriloba macropyga]|uniref:uncharacterized protein LOC142354670 n=1 Tax=Convolutriloba macropyga TaxID=536237 RepID=UPI003F51B275